MEARGRPPVALLGTFLSSTDVMDHVGGVDDEEGARDARGRVRNVVGRVGRAAVNGIKRFASPARLSARPRRAARARDAEDVSESVRAVPESPKRKASQGLPRALRFGDPEGGSAKARRFDVRRVFGKVPSSENLAAAKGAASSTR